MMPDFCTCGAELPPDARFCHKCGKPQREETIPEPVADDAPPALPSPAATRAPPLPPTFRNPIAVRVGLSAASIAAMLISLPFVNYGSLIWLICAGFGSVYLYKWRTGQLLTVRGGARLGWITGVLSFAILTILHALSLALVGVSGLAAEWRRQLHSMAVQDSNVRGAMQALESPGAMAIMFLLALIFLFIVFSLLCMAGGALGAKIMSKD